MKVCVLIAAHNEAPNLAATLESCAGTPTYVVDDSSTDDTAIIARRYTPYVIQVQRGGKGRALKVLIDTFDICNQYEAFIILDGDTLLAPGAVAEFAKALDDPQVAGAVGNMTNKGTSLFASWRSIQYLQVFTLLRRGMAAVNCIYVMCGTCSIWRTELFKQLDWHDTPVEDMDWTYQLHRKKIGKIAYASKADVITQEPATLRDYAKQMLRWLRGYWLTTHRYNAPFGGQSLDFGQMLIIGEMCLSWTRLILVALLWLVPWLTNWLLLSFGMDILILSAFGVASAIVYRKPRILYLLPLLPLVFLLDTLINFYSFITYRRLTSGVWISPKRLAAEPLN